MEPYPIGTLVEVSLPRFWDALPAQYERWLGPIGSVHEVTGALWGRIRVAAVDQPIDFGVEWFRRFSGETPVTSR